MVNKEYSLDILILQEELKQDSSEIANLLKANPSSQLLRRTYVRTIFAEFEANIFFLKKILIYCNHSNLISLKSDENYIINEEKYYLNDNGKIKTSINILRTLPNIKFTISIFDNKFNSTENAVKIDWNKFEKALKIRNRIVHPKLLDDFIIKETEMNVLVENYNSFYKTVSNLLDRINYLVTNDEKFAKYFKSIKLERVKN